MNGSHEDARGRLQIREARRIERIFIYHRWLYVVAIVLLALVYKNLPVDAILALSLGLAAANLAVWRLYGKLDTIRRQSILSLSILIIDGLASWVLMLLFIKEPSAIVYAVFALVVIEGAVRFGLAGSLSAGGFFIMGLSAAWIYRVRFLNMSFDVAAYVFWAGFITLISIMVGMAIREGRKQRAYAEVLSTERTLLLERRRISTELHDTVLKSLQGLALEAHAMGKFPEPPGSHPVEERARYIEEVCNSMSQEIRGVALELREQDGNLHEGIAAQMMSIVKNWSVGSGIPSEFSFDGEVPALPLKLAHDLRRLLGEALSNVQRHSGATLAKVEFESTGDTLKLRISDNGHGFDCRSDDLYSFVRKGRLGLVSMKERTELAGGSFNIRSGDNGTIISVILPLAKGNKGELVIP